MSDEITHKVEAFFAQYKLRNYSKGQILILNGDTAQYVYYLLKGRVKQYDVTNHGDEIILNIFKPPAFFPMSLVINSDTDNPYIYEAETDIEIRQAPAKDTLEFVKANPDVLLDLISRVYRGVDGLLGRVVHLMSGSAGVRLMYELLLECRRMDATAGTNEYTLQVNEVELAGRSGLSRETVSREMHKLKDEGLVSLERHHIIVKDLKSLKRKMGIEI